MIYGTEEMPGYGEALMDFDRRIPDILARMKDDDPW